MRSVKRSRTEFKPRSERDVREWIRVTLTHIGAHLNSAQPSSAICPETRSIRFVGPVSRQVTVEPRPPLRVVIEAEGLLREAESRSD